MLTVIQQRVNGASTSSMAEFRLAKKMAAVLLETTVSLKDFQDFEEAAGVAAPDTLFLKTLRGNELLSLHSGSLVIVPSRQALAPTVAGAIEVFPDPLTFLSLDHCGGYVFEIVNTEQLSRIAFLKLVATFTASNPLPELYDPEPEIVIQGLMWRLEFPIGYEGKVFSGGTELDTWLAQVGRLPLIPPPICLTIPTILPGVVGAVGVGGIGNVPAAVTGTQHGGKLGYVNFTDIDGRLWRASTWKDYNTEYKSAVNWIRSADRERYKIIAGEYVVKTDSVSWLKKLMSFEHISPCPSWAETICYLSSVKKLNIYGKEDLFFSGEVSREDFSQISWEQFSPKGHVYDRESSFNSLMLACDGFRIASLFYYGKAWNTVAMKFKSRIESGDLKTYLPEYVNYLAHQGLVHFYSVMTNLTVQVEYVFTSDSDPAEIFDRCIDKVVSLDRLADLTFWRRYEDQWKKEISFSIVSKKRLSDGEILGMKKDGGDAKRIKESSKSFVHLGDKEFVCWRNIEQALGIAPLKMTALKFRGQCSGKPKCKDFHPDTSGIPFKQEFLENVKLCKILTADDKVSLEKAIKVWY